MMRMMHHGTMVVKVLTENPIFQFDYDVSGIEESAEVNPYCGTQGE